MRNQNLSASVGLAVGTITLLSAIHCQASLLDCAKIQGVDSSLKDECGLGENHLPAPGATGLPAGENSPPKLLMRAYEANTHQVPGSPPDVLSVVVFFAGLLGILWVRAKSCSTK